MKKSLIFLLSLVLISSILSAAQLPLTEVDGDFNLYDRYGNKIDVMDAGPYAEEGYIILTEKGASFTCPYGEIHLEGGTLFTILSLLLLYSMHVRCRACPAGQDAVSNDYFHFK